MSSTLTWPADAAPLTAPANPWLAWDEPDDMARFVTPPDTHGVVRARFAVTGLHCAACSTKLEAALMQIPGVQRAAVQAAARTAEVAWQPRQCRPSDIAVAASGVGYPLRPLDDPGLFAERQRGERLALWRWLVALFAMMQVMMYTSPAYFTEPGEIGESSAALLRWAAWVLTLPVMLFSATPFFAGAWRDLRQRRVGMDTPVALGIAITFVMGTLSTFEPTGPWGHELYLDSLTMFVAFLLTGRWLEARLHHRTAGALEALTARVPTLVRRETGQGIESVPLARVVRGDVVWVASGEAFCADAVLLDPSALVEEALMTGEAEPQTRHRGQQLLAGSLNLGGPVRVRVEQLGRDTRFAAIVELMRQAQSDKPRAVLLADRWAPTFLLAVIACAVMSAAWWWPTAPAKAVMVAVAVLIVTCPCALSLATPAALLSAAGALARRGLLVRRLGALERLAQVQRVIFDKTGTACVRQLQVHALVRLKPLASVASEADALRMVSALAALSAHPVSQAVLAFMEAQPEPEGGLARPSLRDSADLPGLGVEAIDGAGRRWRLGHPQWALPTADNQPDPALASLRVVLSCSEASAKGWASPQACLGFQIGETLHPGMAAAVQALQPSVAVELLSGDQAARVERVAQALGVTQWRGNARPADKQAHLRAAQQGGEVVAMVGDGLNDGPTLAQADVSFAMGDGVALAQSQADFVVQSSNPADVAWALELARRTQAVIRQNLVWAAAYNAACVPLAMLGWLPPWLAGLGMALSSLLVVGNALRLSRS